MTTQKNWYYKIVDNETGETEYYIEIPMHLRTEALCRIICNIIGIEKASYHAVEITEDEYEEGIGS